MSEIDTWIAEHGYNPDWYNPNQSPPPSGAQPGDTRTVNLGNGLIAVQEYTGGTVTYDMQGNPIMTGGGWSTIGVRDVSSGGGGSAGATWRPGEYELEQQQFGLQQQQLWISTALEQAKLKQQGLSDQWQQAVAEGNLRLQQQIERDQVANNAEMARLQEQANAINVYNAQLSAKANLANTAANVATTASQWAANPRDAFSYLKLQETGLTGGSATPLTAAANNPATTAAYQTGLERSFNDLFGGVGQQLADALAATNETPVAAAPWYESDPNYGGLSENQQAVVRNYTPEQRTQYLNFMNMTPEQKKYVIGAGTPSMAGGGKMTINEPSGIVGLLSKRLYATMAEDAPETLSITPMKQAKTEGNGSSVPGFASGGSIYVGGTPGAGGTPTSQIKPVDLNEMRKQGYKYIFGGGVATPEQKKAAFGSADQPGTVMAYGAGLPTGAGLKAGLNAIPHKAARGGLSLTDWVRARAAGSSTPIVGPGGENPNAADSPEMKLAKQLAATLKPLGIDYTPTAGAYAPTPNVLVGSPWARLQNYPSILAMLEAAASQSGYLPGDYWAEQKMFSPTAPSYSPINYSW